MLKCRVEVSVVRKNGSVKTKKNMASRSFLKQFAAMLMCLFDYGVGYTVKDTGGTNRTIQAYGYPQVLDTQGVGGSDCYPFRDGSGGLKVDGSDIGVVVGTGTTAVAPDDYALTTKIAEGSGSGQLQHFGTKVGPVAVSSPDASFDIERIFRNESGNSIEVSEIGLYARTDGSYMACLIKDLLASPVEVADGEILKVKYTIKITA